MGPLEAILVLVLIFVGSSTFTTVEGRVSCSATCSGEGCVAAAACPDGGAEQDPLDVALDPS